MFFDGRPSSALAAPKKAFSLTLRMSEPALFCPARHDRIGKLYLPSGGDIFAGRKAWRLAYRSQRVARRDRPLEALFRIQAKLGGRQGVGSYLPRPKGMWQRTYDRHLERYWELDHLCALEMMAMAGRMRERL